MCCVSNSVYHNRERYTRRVYVLSLKLVLMNSIIEYTYYKSPCKDQAHFNEQVEEMKI
jgi:hypothetical protein